MDGLAGIRSWDSFVLQGFVGSWGFGFGVSGPFRPGSLGSRLYEHDPIFC